MTKSFITMLTEHNVHEAELPLSQAHFEVFDSIDKVHRILESKSICLSADNLEKLSKPNSIITLNNYESIFTIINKEIQ